MAFYDNIWFQRAGKALVGAAILTTPLVIGARFPQYVESGIRSIPLVGDYLATPFDNSPARVRSVDLGEAGTHRDLFQVKDDSSVVYSFSVADGVRKVVACEPAKVREVYESAALGEGAGLRCSEVVIE